MPYIKSASRLRLAKGGKATESGELNYLITREIINVLEERLTINEFKTKVRELVDEYCENVGFKYQTANDVMGALVGAGTELHRRNPDLNIKKLFNALSDILTDFYTEVIADYENKKIVENGDVYKSIITWQ